MTKDIKKRDRKISKICDRMVCDEKYGLIYQHVYDAFGLARASSIYLDTCRGGFD